MFLVDHWKKNVKDTNNDVLKICKNHDKKEIRKILYGFDSLGFVNEWTPIMLLIKDTEQFHQETIISMVANGIDINMNCIHGYNSLHLCIFFIFYGQHISLTEIEFLLSLGADPNKKAIFLQNEKKISLFNGIEFFQALLNDSINIFDWFFWQESNTFKNQLDDEKIIHFYYLMLIYNSDIPKILLEDPIFSKCYHTSLENITSDMINHIHPLRNYIKNYWCLIDDEDIFMKHQYYLRYKKFPEHSFPSNGIYLNFDFDYEMDSSPVYFFPFFQESVHFYFYKDIIPSILLSGKNPYNNSIVEDCVKYQMIQFLIINKPFRYQSKTQKIEHFPRLFFSNSIASVKDEIILLNIAIEIITNIHPYSNIFLTKNLSWPQIQYICRQLSAFPYHLFKFKRIRTEKEFLQTTVYYLMHNDRHSFINKIHFGLEESVEDIKTYKIIRSTLQNQHVSMPFSFFDAILNNEILNCLIERSGNTNMTDIESIWFRIISLHCYEQNLNENTWPLLLE